MNETHGFFQITQKLFLRNQNSILILRDRKSGHGDLPGGRINEPEFFFFFLEGLKRELREELGENIQYDIEPQPIFFARHRVVEGKYPCLIVAYEGKFLGGDIQLSNEHDYMEWVDRETYNPEPLFKKHLLFAVSSYLQNPAFRGIL
ncbi:MAG: NUDIX hydrolase [Leptospiraceae bacterium]|nr:NUDIX hydrolase [Leptospiraceae bacterium]